MNRHCHNCGTEWAIDGQPGRSDACPGCNEDLRACLNCVFHDRGVAYQCRERRAEPVTEKNRSNFCEYFDFAQRNWSGGSAVNKRAVEAKGVFDKLFGD